MSTTVHPSAVVDRAAELGEGVEIGPYCVVGPNVKLGARTRLISHAVVDGWTEVGEDTLIHPFAHLGGPPQHVAHKGEETRLVVGARNLIREQVTMHAGTALGGGLTRVGDDGLYFVGAHVAHDCMVGDSVILTNHATLGGHVEVGDFAILGGLAGVHQRGRVGRYAFVGAGAIVTKDVIPYGSVWGNHAHLEGLNLVGLRRRGFTREAINELRAAYRLLFAPEGTFAERLEDASETYAHSGAVQEIVSFIKADASRPICLPSP